MDFFAPLLAASVFGAVLATARLVLSALDQSRLAGASAGKLPCWLVALVAALASGAAAADHFRNIDGVSVYLGVIPSALVFENVDMHDGFARKEGHYHLTVALFDSETGNRLQDAAIEAEVAPAGLENSRFRMLEPMEIADTITFGNYFELPLRTVYRINVRIRLPDRAEPLEAIFEYDRRDPEQVASHNRDH